MTVSTNVHFSSPYFIKPRKFYYRDFEYFGMAGIVISSSFDWHYRHDSRLYASHI